MLRKQKESQSASLVGIQIGAYILDKLLERSDWKAVYQAQDVQLQRMVLLQIFDEKQMPSEEAFMHHARALARLSHMNIATIYQFGQEKGIGYYLATEYIDRHTLADEIAAARKSEKNLEISRTLHLLGQIASALDYAHSHSVIHRAITPHKIMIDPAGKAVLADFDTILLPDEGRTLGTAYGTPNYISPEQALVAEKSVPQSDIYALGVIAYELLTGRLPFIGETPMEVALAHISDSPPSPHSINPAIPLEAEQVLLKVLEKEPQKRYQTASAFADALKAPYKLEGKSANSVAITHIFISYSRADTSIMRRVCDHINSEKLSTWVDETELEPGTPAWESAVGNAIRGAACVAVLLSPDAEKSIWVGREIAMAETLGKRIFPLLVRGDEKTAIPFRLMSHQFIDARHDTAAALERLVASVRKHLGG